MRNLFVVTHPESTHHVDGRVGGWYDSELTPAGLRAAAAIGAALATRVGPGDVEVVSSDLRRTLQTARAIGDALDAPVTTDPGLREKSYGDAEGRPQAWLDERFVPPPPTGERMRHDEGIPGAETKWDLAVRVYAAVDRVLERDREQQVVVTHGMAATFVLARWIGMPLEAAGHVSFPVRAGSISHLREDDFFRNRAVVSLGEVEHLPG